MALKQTKELEKKTAVSQEPAETNVPNGDAAKAPPAPTPRPAAVVKIPSQLPVIPKADRLVINLQEDSSDSSGSEEEDNVVNSITALLRSARQTVEKTEKKEAASTLQDMSVLPRNKQEEYQRLKQELIRRQNIRLQQQEQQTPSPSGRNAMLTQSQSDNIPKCQSPCPANSTSPQPQSSVSSLSSLASTSAAPVANSAGPLKKKLNTQSVSPLLSPTAAGGSKENQLAKGNDSNSTGSSIPSSPVAESRNESPAKAAAVTTSNSISPARIAAIKEQLTRKRFVATFKKYLTHFI